MAVQTRQIVWLDAAGRTRVTLPSADPDSSTIMSKLQLHSNADVLRWFEGPPTILSPVPPGGTYASVSDIARLTFTDPTGDLVDLALLAPDIGIFLADSVTVDPSAIADIITACVGVLVTQTGTPVSAFVGGLRGQRSAGE